MQDADKIKQHICAQLEAARAVNSDFITLTVDEGKDLLSMVASPKSHEEQTRIINNINNAISTARYRDENKATVPLSLLTDAIDYINYLLLPF